MDDVSISDNTFTHPELGRGRVQAQNRAHARDHQSNIPTSIDAIGGDAVFYLKASKRPNNT